MQFYKSSIDSYPFIYSIASYFLLFFIAPPPRQRIESESDYDSYEDDEYDDMDGFIDDGDAETDVSSAIKDIFGYDKNK